MTSHKKVFKASKANTEIIEQYLTYYQNKKPNASKDAKRGINGTLRKLSEYIQPKSLKDATEQNLMNFLGQIKKPASRDTYANHITPFYRYIYKTPKNSRPPNMEWFEFSTQREKRKHINPNLKEELLISNKEIQQMLNYGHDRYGQLPAIWETYYLSGIRPSELQKMKIKDVTTNQNGNILITITDSKTIPRQIPLPQTPYKLLEYIENHPEKNNPDAPLWFSLKNTAKITPLSMDGIRDRFTKMKERIQIKKTLLIKSFRKTRATIVFTEDKLNDKDIGKIFGWTPKTVIERRTEYELSDTDDLAKKYCTKTSIQPSYTQLKKQIKEQERLIKIHNRTTPFYSTNIIEETTNRITNALSSILSKEQHKQLMNKLKKKHIKSKTNGKR